MSILCGVYGYQDLDKEKNFLLSYIDQSRSADLLEPPDFYIDELLIIGIHRSPPSNSGHVILEEQYYEATYPHRSIVWGCGEILPSSSGIDDLGQLSAEYARRGPKVFADVNGQWNIIIRDGSSRQLVLATDPIGVCKLYYRQIGSSLYFSNTLSYFRHMQPEIDKQAVADFLRFVYIPAPNTIYKDVRSLSPGSAVTYDGQRCSETPYALPNYKTIFANQMQSAVGPEEFTAEVERFARCLTNAVDHSLGNHRNVALLLSGGKDSSSLAFAASGHSEVTITACHIGSNQPAVDESRSAEFLARRLNMPYRRYCFDSADYIDSFHEIIATMDQPFGDPTYYPVFLLLQRIKEDYDVVLDGTGCDGYFGVPLTPSERKIYRFRQSAPHWLQELFRRGLKGIGKERHLRLYAKCSGPVHNLFAGWYGWSYTEIKRLLGYDRHEESNRFYQIYQRLKEDDPAVLKTAIICGSWEPENVYRRSCAAAASHGMQVRFPFLDIDLMRYVSGLPTEMKFQGSVNKILLRQYMTKHLPEEIVRKPKGYFIFDTNSLLAGNDFQLVKETLSESALKQDGWFNPGVVSSLVKSYRSGNFAVSKKLYAIILLRCWLQIHS